MKCLVGAIHPTYLMLVKLGGNNEAWSMKEYQRNKGQKSTWEGNGAMKHHAVAMHEGRATK
jgi:hypothetical protein